MSAASVALTQTAPRAAELRSTLGHLVCVVGAHGGAGTTRAAVALARDATRDACLIDADLSGGDAHALLELPERPGDVGLAAVSEVAAAVFAHGARRTAFGWLFDVSPRPELAWLIRDGAVRDLGRVAMHRAALVVVDAGRPTGPSFEAVLDADVVVLLAHADRGDAIDLAERRLIRSGVDERRVLACATAPTVVERALGLLRRDLTVIDVERDDRLALLVEGRLAAIGPRDRA